jgi:hypothetical protein
VNVKEEGLLRDYIAIGVIGFAIAIAISASGEAAAIVNIIGLATNDLARTAALDVVAGIFAFTPAAIIATYINYKLHKTEGKMEGITVGLMIFFVHLFITLFMTISRNAILAGDIGGAMVRWALMLVFALVFYLLGGFLSGIFINLKMPMPGVFRFQRAPRGPTPPPPPGMAAQTCPTCGGPLRYIQQYQRWYCDKEQKYV